MTNFSSFTEPIIVATCAHCGDDITEDQEWIDDRWQAHVECLEEAEREAELRGRPHEFYN